MSASAGRSVGELRDALRGYIARHPSAADGLDGIRWWWLPPHLQGVTRERLHEALMDLVERNEMLCTALPDGTELYARDIRNQDTHEHDGHVHSVVPTPTTSPEPKE